ncbi:MAG TPA: rRNA maturation RNase YbeY [Flavobacterium sp.]|nr:rRNA maturation RNase YbeY [Flavobacterium sp.]
MITFNFENDFSLNDESFYTDWIQQIITSENKDLGTINFVFCNDEYLLGINQQYLNHDTYTDIISFDYTQDNVISGDIFISTERVLENAQTYNVSFDHELLRVMAHGVLHYCGYKDKSESESETMRLKEDEKISMFHVEPIKKSIN